MSFLNPLFLIGGLAAAVPVLLHLVRREHAKKIEFPTLMFLRRISRKTIRYRKLRRLLLLLLRVFALLFIVLAFMRPYRETTEAAPVAGIVTTAHIIALDNSMSMDYRDRWEQARKAASAITRNSNPGDRFAVVEFSDTALGPARLTTASEALSRIEAIEPTDRPTRYGQALRAAEKLALDAGTGKRIVHLISDFQKNGWTSDDQDFRLAAGVELRTIDVGSDEFSNITIRDVRITEADETNGNETKLTASVVNFGNLDRKNIRISLSVDGREVADRRIDISGSASQGIDFRLPRLVPGTRRVVLTVDDPNLQRDNRFHLNLQARGKTQVQLVENPAKGRHSSFFLSKALDIDVLSPYTLKPAAPEKIIRSGGLLIWNDVPGRTAAVQEKIRDFVEAGGGLVLVLGESTNAGEFNRSFGSWLPVKVAEPPFAANRTGSRPVEDYVLMTDISTDHPIFRPFSQPHSGSFSSARFFRHVRVSVSEGSEVPARFDNGDPALVAANAGKGRVLVFASSADDSMNDLPLKAVYAPFWQQMLRFLEKYRERRHWREIGETIDPRKLLMDAAGNSLSDESIAVLDPAGQRLTAGGDAEHVLLEKSGFYEIRTMNSIASVAANTPPKESDLTHGDAEEMAAGWVSHGSAEFRQEGPVAPEEQEKRQRIWILFLIAGAVLLVSEMLLSRAATDNRPATPVP